MSDIANEFNSDKRNQEIIFGYVWYTDHCKKRQNWNSWEVDIIPYGVGVVSLSWEFSALPE